jgi:hypothetical protein
LIDAQRLTSTSRINTELYGMDIFAEDLNRLHDRVENVDLDTLDESQREELFSGVRNVTIQIAGEAMAQGMNLSNSFRYALESDDKYSLIPEGHYLMLGDNSGNSGDGRQFGWVPHKNLYGRAFAVALPPSHMKDLTGFFGTWWGKLLLLGLPGAIVLYEYIHTFIGLSWRVRGERATAGLANGDHVWISRLAVGLRIPFLRNRYFFRRSPSEGALIAFMHRDHASGHAEVHFGRLLRINARRYTIDCSGQRCETDVNDVIGRVLAVWWPLGRRIHASTQE